MRNPSSIHLLRCVAAAILLTVAGLNCEAAVLSPRLRQTLQSPAASPGRIRYAAQADGEGIVVRYYPLIIRLTSPDATLPDEVTILARRANFVLAYVPENLLETLAGMGQVSRIEGGNVCTPALDVARTFTGLPKVAAGENLPAVYTGRGVVVGFTDVGFDPNHPAFRDSATGRSRVRRLVNFGDSPEDVTRLSAPADIAAWTTDNSDMWHATHVAGILAGSYPGNPYQGIATGADIVATTGTLVDALLLAGMEEVVDYARNEGKPAVINMSVSTSTGPHDGTSLFCQYLELLGDEATICISAGNTGTRYGHWSCTFSDAEPSIDCGPCDVYSWNFRELDGVVDIWNSDSSPLTIEMLVYDTDTESTVTAIPLVSPSADNPEILFSVATSAEAVPSSVTDYDISEQLAAYFSGAVTVSTEVNPDNGRFNAYVHINVKNLPDSEGEPANRYLLGLRTSGDIGDTASAYAGENVKFYLLSGTKQSAITSNGCINDFVTGRGVIGVGAMCSRNEWPLTEGGTDSNEYTPGLVANFSSFYNGPLSRQLPDVVAPGTSLVSAISRPYLEANPDYQAYTSCRNTVDGVDYYWTEAGGTSMSSPFVAGVCALWLEANPSLQPAEVREIVERTLSAPTEETWNLRWGRGILDSYAGVQEALRLTGIEQVAADGESYENAAHPSDGVYDLQGRRLPDVGLPAGIYIRRAGGLSTKFIVN